MGHVESIERRHRPALEFYQQALAIRKAIGDRPGMGASLLAVAQAYEALGDYGGAEPLLAQALSIQRAVRNRFEEALALNELGILYWLVGDFPHALASLDAGLSLSRPSRASSARPTCSATWARCCATPGASRRPLPPCTRVSTSPERRRMPISRPSTARTLPWQNGWPATSTPPASMPPAESLFRELDQQASLTAVFATQAQIAAARGDLPAARAAVERTLAILDSPTGAEADFPHRDYLHCAQVLHAWAIFAREHTCMAAAQALVRERAARITSPQMRAGYLTNVPANRAILAWQPTLTTGVR